MAIFPLATCLALIAAAAGCGEGDPGAEPRRAWTATYEVARGDDVWLGGTLSW